MIRDQRKNVGKSESPKIPLKEDFWGFKFPWCSFVNAAARDAAGTRCHLAKPDAFSTFLMKTLNSITLTATNPRP